MLYVISYLVCVGVDDVCDHQVVELCRVENSAD